MILLDRHILYSNSFSNINEKMEDPPSTVLREALDDGAELGLDVWYSIFTVKLLWNWIIGSL